VAPALRDLENCDFISVNRAQTGLAEQFARKFGARKWEADWQNLVVDPEIQAVYIATPVNLHAEQTIAAAKEGKHVLCEKPLAMNTAECDDMIRIERESQVKCGVAYYRHFYPVINRIMDIIAGGEIGRVVMIQINAFERFNPQPGEPRFWFMKQAQAGGGPMMDFGCHRIEVMLHILGPIRRVRGILGNALYKREVEDTAIALFEFENNAQGVLSVTHAAQEPQDTLEIFGSEGSIRVPVLNQGHMIVTTAGGERTEAHPPHLNIHQPLIDDFTRAVLQDRDPAVGFQIGRDVAAIEDMIYER
jgi:predicted dehydrogenase